MGDLEGLIGYEGRTRKEDEIRVRAELTCNKAWREYKEEYDPKEVCPEFIWHEPFKLPKKPKDKKSIANYAKPKSERKFPYYTEDEKIRYSSLDEKGEYRYPEWIKEEIRRRFDGFFFYNGDKLEWVTGHHYMTLQYWLIPVPDKDTGRMKRGNPYFIDAQRDVWYAINAMREDKNSMGAMLIGYRRFSKTVTAIAEGYWDTTENEESIFPIQSKTEKDAEKVFAKLIDSWKLLPAFLKPVDDGSTSQAKKLVFDHPKKKVSRQERVNKPSLRSKIYPVTSTEVEVDGDYVSFFFKDEFLKGKINNDVQEAWYVTKPTLMVGNTIVGKALFTSTVEDSEKYGSAHGRRLWDESDASQRNSMGQTKSGMYQLFVPASYGYMGETEKDSFVDEWGYSDVPATVKFHKANLKGLNGDRLLSQKRKFPLSIWDAWIKKDNDNTFDAAKLIEQQTFVRETTIPQLVRGNFEWVNGIRDTSVMWIPHQEGKWWKTFDPMEDDRCKTKMIGTQRAPQRNYFYTGIDPYSNDSAVRYGSNGSGITIAKNYPTAPFNEGVVCYYNFRPKTANMFAEDMIKQAVYYSSPILVERNTGGFRQYFDERGYKSFLLKNPLETDPRKKAREDAGYPNNSKDAREDLLNMTASYIIDNFGYNEELGTHGFIYFQELIEQLIDFDVMKWTKYDSVVAFGLAVIASRAHKKDVNISKYNIKDWFRMK